MPDAPLSDAIVREEEALLADVVHRLHEVPVLLPPSEKDVVEELVRLREELVSAKAEDKPAILQQYDHFHALLQQLRDARERPQVDPSSPYFAHLRLEEDGVARDMFLGKATRIDHGLRIIDWRNAPISRIFYAYQQDDEYEEAFGGRRMEGTITARRTLRVEGGRLLRVDAPEGMFVRDAEGGWHARAHDRAKLAGGQGAARIADAGGTAGLGVDRDGPAPRADKHLPEIASLLDPEQFDLITRPTTGLVVIRGTAGSGKTTVALHRIAWLAHEDARVDSDRTLFLVFSKALRDYVGRVLPALGVHRVVPQTFPDWAARQRRRHFPSLPSAVRDDTPEIVLRLKAHPATMIALERQRDAVVAPGSPEQAIDDWASVLTSAELLEQVFAELDPEAFTPAELRRAVEYSRDRHAELVAWLEAKAIRAGELDPDDRDAAPVAPPEQVALDVEDDPLLLRAWQLRVGPLRGRHNAPLTYLHVAIDEVQDFTPVEVRVLLDCLDDRRSMTLAGDTQQHVMADAGFTSWSAFFRWLGVEGTAVDTLRIAYRSSEPIVTFANHLLGEVAEDDTPPLTVRGGPPVEVFRFTDDGAAVAFLADALHTLARREPLASVAIVTPDPASSATFHTGLAKAGVPRLSRVEDETFAFAPGVEVVDVRQVKGLEFDYVVVVGADARHYPDTASARRLLHVAATRAVHQLWVLVTGTPSPVLREAVEGGTAGWAD